MVTAERGGGSREEGGGAGGGAGKRAEKEVAYSCSELEGTMLGAAKSTELSSEEP